MLRNLFSAFPEDGANQTAYCDKVLYCFPRSVVLQNYAQDFESDLVWSHNSYIGTFLKIPTKTMHYYTQFRIKAVHILLFCPFCVFCGL